MEAKGPLMELRTIKMVVKLTPSEREEIKRLAKESNTTMSRYMRAKALSK